MEQQTEQVVSTETFIKERKYLMNVSEGTLRFYEDTFRSVFSHGDFTEEGLKRWVVGSRDAGNTPRTVNPFSCGEHGSGAIDLVMNLKKIGFQEAVSLLGTERQRGLSSSTSTSLCGVCLQSMKFIMSLERIQ